jgi:DNA-binding transcriptional LysR family regulator
MHNRMTLPPDWSHYRTFLAVLDAGSLSGAARALGIAQPTVGRQIEALETALGGDALFTRSPMAAAAETLIRTASGDAGEVRGVVRVTASEVVGAEVLPPIIAEFRETWPRVVIELVLSNRQEDLLRRDADIAVRMARPTQQALLARSVGAVPLNFHAHRSYLQKHGEPRSMAELVDHDLIGYDRVVVSAETLKALNFPVTNDLFALRSDNELAQLALMRAGAGIGVCQRPIGARDPNLTPILESVFAPGLEMWVLMHEDLRGDARMRRLFDHLVVGLKAYVASGRPAAP